MKPEILEKLSSDIATDLLSDIKYISNLLLQEDQREAFLHIGILMSSLAIATKKE